MTVLSQNEIRKKGIEALAEALGPVGMIRFLQQFDTGKGSYTDERSQWLDDLTIDDVITKIRSKKQN